MKQNSSVKNLNLITLHVLIPATHFVDAVGGSYALSLHSTHRRIMAPIVLSAFVAVVVAAANALTT